MKIGKMNIVNRTAIFIPEFVTYEMCILFWNYPAKDGENISNSASCFNYKITNLHLKMYKFIYNFMKWNEMRMKPYIKEWDEDEWHENEALS